LNFGQSRELEFLFNGKPGAVLFKVIERERNTAPDESWHYLLKVERIQTGNARNRKEERQLRSQESMSIQRNNPVNPAEFLILCPLVRWIPAQRLLKRNPRFTAVLSSSILYVLLFIIGRWNKSLGLVITAWF